MISLGEQLRLAREQRRLTVAEVAQQTCISSRYLHAMERNELSQLPGGCFTRSFIRQYGAALGLPPEDLHKHLQSMEPAEPMESGIAPRERHRAWLWSASLAGVLLCAFVLKML